MWFKFGEKDSPDGEFLNDRKDILQSAGRKEKRLGKYPLYLHFTDEDTESQRLDHLFHITPGGSSRQHMETELSVSGCCCTARGCLLHKEQDSICERFKPSAGWEFREERLPSGWGEPQSPLGRNIVWTAPYNPNYKAIRNQS